MTLTPGPVRRWVLAARVRTLPAALVPVVLGAGLVRPASINWGLSAVCAVIALALQIGTNYANDYSDGRRGTDEVRVGPFRLTASRLVSAATVRRAAWLCFGVAAVAGVVLAAHTSWWLVPLGASAVAAGWFYTGGPKPYGYYGFGELFVMIYFGFVATVGTSYAQHRHIVGASWWWGLAAGAMACVLLEANNLRDVEGDRQANKKTLAARLGRERGAWLYVGFVLVAVGALVAARAWLAAAVAAVLYYPGVRVALSSRRGRDLLVLLALSARAQLAIGAASVVVFALR